MDVLIIDDNAARINPTADKKPTKEVVMKSLVRSRGAANDVGGSVVGVHVGRSAEQVREIAAAIIDVAAPEPLLVDTKQPTTTTSTEKTTRTTAGHQKVLLVERLEHRRREMYLSLFMDRASQGPLLVGCSLLVPLRHRDETDAAESLHHDVTNTAPDAMFTQPIDIVDGLQDEQCERMVDAFNLEGPARDQAVTLLQRLYSMFIACDCTQIEINPLVETSNGDVVVGAVQMNCDDNARYRQSSLYARRRDDPTTTQHEDPREVEASWHHLNYVGLDGNIGCMVNGAVSGKNDRQYT